MEVVVIGSGSWGQALAKLYNAKIIAGREQAQSIKADFCFIAVEAQKFQEVIIRHKFALNACIVIATKGIEQKSLKLMSQILTEKLPNNYAILSGPNFADEIMANLPAVSTIAGNNPDIVKILSKPSFRLYYSDDVISTQIGGAVKNVIAIASGISYGLNLGENARAAIITRGLAEIKRLTKSLGGDENNLLGPAGVGDLILTAMNAKSRNTKFGQEIALGGNIEQIIAQRQYAIEGYYTAESVYNLAVSKKIEMPICFAVHDVLYNKVSIQEAVNGLINRPQ